MKIVFFGSDDFALAHLQALKESTHEVAACVAQPDRPKGRGMKVTVAPVKEFARCCGMEVFQPESLRTDAMVQSLCNIHADLFVVIAYGKLLPKEIIKIPAFGAINVHASLLPKYRGAAPINWAIINGETETGISIIRINDKMDAGDILASMVERISLEDTAVTLRARMMAAGPRFLLKTIEDMRRGAPHCVPEGQDDRLATLAPRLTKEMGRIQWAQGAFAINCLVRGLLPWPGAYTSYNGEQLKILEVQVAEKGISDVLPGSVVNVDKAGILVATGKGGVLVRRVHLQGSKPMDAHCFVAGHKIGAGYRFA